MATRHSAPKKSPSQRSTKDSGLVPEFFDPKMEFDAPMFHNFGSLTPEADHVDHWFDARLYEIQNHLFEEPKYSPITLQKHLQSKMVKVRTPSARKKKVVNDASDSLRENIPKMLLDDVVEEASRSSAPSAVRSPQTVVIKVVATEVQVSQQPAVPFSALDKLASLPMKPFVVAQAVPLPSLTSCQANNQNPVKVEMPSQFTQDARATAPEPPIRKRKLWEKPEIASKSRAWSPVKRETPGSAIKSEPQERPFTRSSVATKTATASNMTSGATPVASKVLTARTPATATHKQLAKTPVAVALKLPAKTPVAAVPKAAAQTPLEPAVARKPAVPVASRYAQAKVVRNDPPLTRSRANREIKSNGRMALTRPKEFSFMSRTEVTKKPQVEQFVPEKIKELTVFPSLLRADSDPVPPQPKGLTRPVEFRFATTARAKTYAPQEVPQVNVSSHPPAAHKGPTQPKEFRFATSARSRATAISSVVQPKPRQAAGVHRRLTVPQAFNLSKSNRPKPVTEPPETRAKAKLAKDTLQNKTVLKTTSRLEELALPASRKRKSLEKADMKVARSKMVSAVAPLAEPLSLTVPEPFDLLTDVRGASKVDRFKRQVEEELQQEKEARVFVARPLPSDAVDELPVVEAAPLTVFEPFHLESEHLSQQAKQKLEERIQYEQALEEEMRQFRANPVSLKRVPFRPLTSNRPLTVPETPKLQSSVRAMDRADFSVEKNQRISLKEQRELQEKALEEEHEKEEIRKLRETLVFKATPYIVVSPMRVGPSLRPLTLAETPRLRTNLRSMR